MSEPNYLAQTENFSCHARLHEYWISSYFANEEEFEPFIELFNCSFDDMCEWFSISGKVDKIGGKYTLGELTFSNKDCRLLVCCSYFPEDQCMPLFLERQGRRHLLGIQHGNWQLPALRLEEVDCFVDGVHEEEQSLCRLALLNFVLVPRKISGRYCRSLYSAFEEVLGVSGALLKDCCEALTESRISEESKWSKTDDGFWKCNFSNSLRGINREMPLEFWRDIDVAFQGASQQNY